MPQRSATKASPWLLALGSGLLMSVVACPKPPSPFDPKKPPTSEPTPQVSVTEAELTEKCMSLDWAQRQFIPEDQRARCRTLPGFEAKLDKCTTQNWIDPAAVPAETQEFCFAVGYKNLIDGCAARDWGNPDSIPAEDVSLCAGFGFRVTLDPDICEKQDWTKPASIPETIKEQCLRISFNPICDPKLDPACVAPTDPAAKELFSHAGHGVDLPNKKRERELTFKGKPIACADCHSGECKTDKKTKKIASVDINRPGHDSCSGTRTGGCHPDFLRNQKVCKSCHTAPPSSMKDKKLRPYGGENALGNIQYGFDFSHKSHVGENNVVSRKGLVANCADCHAAQKDGVLRGSAGHAECGACHCDSGSVPMNDCISCHKVENEEQVKSGHAYLNWRPHAQSFAHKDHETDPSTGKALDCQECHISVSDSNTLTEITVPPMLGCLQGCHDGAHKDKAGKPIFDGWTYCSKCHEAGELPKSTTKSASKKKSKP